MRVGHVLRLTLERALTWLIRPIVFVQRKTGRMHSVPVLSQPCALIPGALGKALRVAALRAAVDAVGENVTVEFGTIFSHDKVTLGENVYIGAFCNVGWANIGKDVLIAGGVHILSGKHTHHFSDASRPISGQGGERTCIRIGDGSWIGSGAIVMADVGAGSVIGAGSVVNRPIPDRALAVGNHARVVRLLESGSNRHSH